MNIIRQYLIIAILAVMVSVAWAGPEGSISFGPVTRGGYDAMLCMDAVIFLEGSPGLGAYKAEDGKWVLKYNEDALKDSKLYVLGTQELWKGGKKAADVDVSAALASAKINGQSVSIRLPDLHPGTAYYQPLIFLVQLASGKRGWFVPGGQFLVRNKLGEEQTLITISEGQIFAPDDKGRQLASQRE